MSLFEELIGRIDARFSTEAKNMSLGEWICANTTLRGRPFSFDRYPFQKAIADDLHPNMAVIKPSQIGLTEIQIRKSLGFITRNRGVSLIYTMPTDDMQERLSSTRVLPLVRDEKVFNLEGQSENRPVRSKGLIQVGSSFMYITGGKEADATSIPADVVFNDEIDISNQQILALFNSRLQNSDWRINQQFSTPTFVNFGVDMAYNGSDQHVYLCKCDACNHWQEPLFTKQFVVIPGMPDEVELLEIDEALIDQGKIDLMNAYVQCEKCRAPLDLGRKELREWVPRFQSRSHHRGYRISPFSTDRLGIDYIVTQLFKYRQRDYMRGFFNTVLGQSYTANNARLSDAQVEACFSNIMDIPKVDTSRPCWLGIDVGQTCHLILSQGETLNRQETILFLSIPIDNLYAEVENILATYNVKGGGVDRHPYTPSANALRDLSNGVIMPIEYRGMKDLNLVKDQLDPDMITHAQVNRTSIIDDAFNMVKSQKVLFRGYGNQKSAIKAHFQDMVRDEQPEKEARWVKLSGNDHYAHAWIFAVAGMKIKELQHGLFADHRSSVAVMGVDLHGDDLRAYGTRARERTSLGVRSYY